MGPTLSSVFFGQALCRSELARESPEGAAFIQDARVIVDDFREHASAYRDLIFVLE